MNRSHSVILCCTFLIAASLTAHAQGDNPSFNCDSIPLLNQEIMIYSNSKMGKKIGNGQCWLFPAEALNRVGAQWDGLYQYGRLIDPEKECIYPGDIIQFEGVLVEYSTENSRTQESMGHHTSIIYKVYSQNEVDLAHQNFGRSKKHVGVTHLDFRNVVKGRYFIYRPVRKS